MILSRQQYEEAYRKAIEKIVRNSEMIGASFPQAAVGENGIYNREAPDYWTGGFWGGLLWLAYRETKNPKLLELAWEIEEIQDGPLYEFENLHHDVGFMWLPTAVFHYRMTGNHKSRVRGMKAAAILASRFNLNGRFIRSWNDEPDKNRSGYVIVDSMMNLPLLFWASKEQEDPRYSQIAEAHADTVLRNFVRDNFTVPHIVEFDPNTGERIGEAPGQGKNLFSEWSRGQAWAIYGFAMAYRETGNKRFLETAEKITERFYSRLPEDKVPYWDFCSDEADRYARDSSAACVAASGMLELARLEEKQEIGDRYESYAKDILGNIIQKYACFDDASQGIVKMGTVNYTHRRYVNVPIIYGDFYFTEALGKILGYAGIF